MPQGPRKCVYVLHGQDDYLRRHHRRKIIEALLPPEQARLGVADLDASAELAEVLDELRTVPLLAPCRVVVINDADKFVTRHRAPLEDYFTSPAPTGSLVLMVNSWPVRTKLARLAARIGETIDCSPPSDSSLPQWVMRLAELRGKRMSRQCAALLAEHVGADLGRLDSEMEKLALYVGPRQSITADDLAAVVAATAGPVAFALTNALTAGDAAKALAALDGLMSHGDQAQRVLGLLAWHVRKGQGGRPQRWPGPHPAAPANAKRAVKAFRELLAADAAIKTGAQPLTSLQLLVTRLCQ